MNIWMKNGRRMKKWLNGECVDEQTNEQMNN